MSFSLSSLLNPEPAQSDESSTTNNHPRKTSLPAPQYAHSPEQEQDNAPLSRVASAPQTNYAADPNSAQTAAEALAKLAASTVPPPTRWYGHKASDITTESMRPDERRLSSSHGIAVELPPPTPTAARKASSPTLEQYQVASRSPDQRKHSLATAPQPALTLPPLQNITKPEEERRPSMAQNSRGQKEGVDMTSSAHQPSASVYANESLPVMGSSDVVMEEKALSPAKVNMGPSQLDGADSSPPRVKTENIATPRTSPPADARRPSLAHLDAEGHTPKALASLKHEHSVNTQSPLRESSVPMPSTEPTANEPTASKKRPAPSKKKGMATMTKKTIPPAKKRKLDIKRSETPASRTSKAAGLKTGSSKGTPANSSPAPSARSNSADPEDEYGSEEEADEDEDVEGSGDVYCICRKPDNGTFMIGCDGTCDDWFHGKCVDIAERDKNLIDKYLCPSCTKAGIGRTTWKRICRRSGCRQPARVSKMKGEKVPSKYCSDECGVLFFREMASKTRDRDDVARHRSRRRKGSIASSGTVPEESLGARGGTLAAGEVKGLLDVSKTAEDFKKLGEGVLSPPATPDGKDGTQDNGEKSDAVEEFTEGEQKTLVRISEQKEEARRRHRLLKDRMKFITLAKQAASRMATEKELKPKEYCGYDPRLEWTLEQFAEWRHSVAGRRAFERDTLAVENSGSTGKANGDTTNGEHVTDSEMVNGTDVAAKDADDEELYATLQVCERKKCARHLEWNKLAVDDVRFEMGDNSDKMRGLDREERMLKEGAVMRGKQGGNVMGGGRVEVYGLGIEGLVEADEGREGNVDVDGVVQQGVEVGRTSAEAPVGTEPNLAATEGGDMVIDGVSAVV
ncbi:COMPASS (complex proteins associated with Set1p) component [Recurvomyces mirabilis]|uniref:COMPASS (complex proteins associated with Set1p) component n=1 Tax=Recurvomyces mirabilis TaxID=574656 RepID=UPI002DDDF42A|nr:COMPASS (complex proteins associated with Set1p) component [Recurvomyces mirabilis]